MLEKSNGMQKKVDTKTDYEVTKKQKNISLLLLFVGLFMIIIGILFPVIMGSVEVMSDVPQAMEIERQSLSCMKNENGSGIVSNTNYIYEFNHDGLIKMKVMYNLMSTEKTIDEFMAISNISYESISAPGLETAITVNHENNSLTTVFSVDYSKFSLEDYQKDYLNTSLNLEYLSYKKGFSREKVEKKILGEGGSCQ